MTALVIDIGVNDTHIVPVVEGTSASPRLPITPTQNLNLKPITGRAMEQGVVRLPCLGGEMLTDHLLHLMAQQPGSSFEESGFDRVVANGAYNSSHISF
jgi:hypothetical protein